MNLEQTAQHSMNPLSTLSVSPAGHSSGDPSRAERVEQFAASIEVGNPMSVLQFGEQLKALRSGYAEELLSAANSKDLDEAGQLLMQVVQTAHAVDINGPIAQPSGVPVLGRFIDSTPVLSRFFSRVRLVKENLIAQYQNTKQTIDGLLNSLESVQNRLSDRILTLESIFRATHAEIDMLDDMLDAADRKLVEANAQIASMSNSDLDQRGLQELADLRHGVSNLEKRKTDLASLRHECVLVLPQVRQMQGNNQALVEQIQTTRSLTIPAWTRQFALRLCLDESNQAQRLTSAVNHATNELLKNNAKLHRKNATATARAENEIMIATETLEAVQSDLMATYADVKKIREEGKAIRGKAMERIGALTTQMKVVMLERQPQLPQ